MTSSQGIFSKLHSKLAVIDGICMGSGGGDCSPQELGHGVVQEPKAWVHVWCQHDMEEHFCKRK